MRDRGIANSASTDAAQWRIAGPLRRFIAALIDTVALAILVITTWILGLLFAYVGDLMPHTRAQAVVFDRFWVGFLNLVFYALMYVEMSTRATIGYRILGCRIYTGDCEVPRTRRVLARTLCKYAAFMIWISVVLPLSGIYDTPIWPNWRGRDTQVYAALFGIVAVSALGMLCIFGSPRRSIFDLITGTAVFHSFRERRRGFEVLTNTGR